MEKQFISQGRRYFVEFLPEEVFKGLSKEEKSNHSKYRHRHRTYHKKLKEVEELEVQVQELKNLIKNKKLLVKGYEREVFKYYDKVKHLDKNLEFLWWEEEEWRNKKICKRNPSVKPQKRVVYRVEYKLGGRRVRKKISCGSRKKIPQLLNGYKNRNKNYLELDKDNIQNELKCGYMAGYISYHLYKYGYNHFHNTPHNLKSVVEWFNTYDETNGKWEGFKWGIDEYSNFQNPNPLQT